MVLAGPSSLVPAIFWRVMEQRTRARPSHQAIVEGGVICFAFGWRAGAKLLSGSLQPIELLPNHPTSTCLIQISVTPCQEGRLF